MDTGILMAELRQRITEYVSEKEEILLAWLFGSMAAGTSHIDSDVDIALLFRRGKEPDADAFLSLKSDLASRVERDVDIVILNQASPIVRMQVLEKGEKLFERERRAYLEFFVRTMNEYDDLKRIRAINEKHILRGSIYDR